MRPKLVITDIEMPCLNGMELLRRIRTCNDTAVREIPVMVITSLLDENISHTITGLGGTRVMVKPLPKELLCHVVRRVLCGETVQQLYDPLAPVETATSAGPISPTLRALVRRLGTT